MQQMNQDNQAVSAFVLFRSMEGYERCLYAFKINMFIKTWLKIFYCCYPKSIKEKLFKGRFLKVE